MKFDQFEYVLYVIIFKLWENDNDSRYTSTEISEYYSPQHIPLGTERFQILYQVLQTHHMSSTARVIHAVM